MIDGAVVEMVHKSAWRMQGIYVSPEPVSLSTSIVSISLEEKAGIVCSGST